MEVIEKQKVVVKKWKVYIANDGKEFYDEGQCERYERDLKNKSLYKFDIDDEKVLNATEDDFDDLKFAFLSYCYITSDVGRRDTVHMNRVESYRPIHFPKTHVKIDSLPKLRGIMVDAIFEFCNGYMESNELYNLKYIDEEGRQRKYYPEFRKDGYEHVDLGEHYIRIPLIDYGSWSSTTENTDILVKIYDKFIHNSNVFTEEDKEFLGKLLLNRYYSNVTNTYRGSVISSLSAMERIIKNNYPIYQPHIVASLLDKILLRSTERCSKEDKLIKVDSYDIIKQDLTNDNRIMCFINKEHIEPVKNFIQYVSNQLGTNEVLLAMVSRAMGVVHHYYSSTSWDKQIAYIRAKKLNPFHYTVGVLNDLGIPNHWSGYKLEDFYNDVYEFFHKGKLDKTFHSDIAERLIYEPNKYENHYKYCEKEYHALADMISEETMINKLLSTHTFMSQYRLFKDAKKIFKDRVKEYCLNIVNTSIGCTHAQEGIIRTIKVSKREKFEDFKKYLIDNGYYVKCSREYAQFDLEHCYGVTKVTRLKKNSGNEFVEVGEEIKVVCDNSIEYINLI